MLKQLSFSVNFFSTQSWHMQDSHYHRQLSYLHLADFWSELECEYCLVCFWQSPASLLHLGSEGFLHHLFHLGRTEMKRSKNNLYASHRDRICRRDIVCFAQNPISVLQFIEANLQIVGCWFVAVAPIITVSHCVAPNAETPAISFFYM